ncbi:hypothetical protein MAPG_09502 [Magnaporthiopsis poae ATCC 64411]|uniref:Uncharacterized protein n=1 Tax=Magnaporthiopsis poae (strain ATCC 64411 / 73-15) TaxID=644358 RepID=A0A0C4EA44_MAGP6|nr:hypothetical protein MAPG_09502 [Magnaporthiopsis poae ATCC 64411]
MLQRRAWRCNSHLLPQARPNHPGSRLSHHIQTRQLLTRSRCQQRYAPGAPLRQRLQIHTSPATTRASVATIYCRDDALRPHHDLLVVPQRRYAHASPPRLSTPGDEHRRVAGCGAATSPDRSFLRGSVPSPESADQQPLSAGLNPAVGNSCSASLYSLPSSRFQSRRYLSSSQARQDSDSKGYDHGDRPPPLGWRMLESAATSFASILVLALGFGGAGYGYHKFYKHLVLQKMQGAFEPGDPVLDLAAMSKGMTAALPPARTTGDGQHAEEAPHWVQRSEQRKVNDIVAGDEVGHYYLFLGEKGTGKSSMLLDAMRKIDGDGVAMFEAHADLEIFRIRLGKALDYEFHEDYIGSYFSERGPRDTTALLDIERALNKLEKVAMLYRKKRPGRPLVVIINQMHLVRDDDDGKDLLELLQQRAEQWAAARLVTMVFNSDDYWVYERFKQLATRMEVVSIQDLPKTEATAALKKYRLRHFQQHLSDDLAEKIYDKVGGRLSFLNRVAKVKDSERMLKKCDDIIEMEKTWFLNQCWILGMEMDDDVMDQQKWASAAMVLALALVDKEAEMDKTYDPVKGHVLPSFALHEAQQIMTRADFIRALDRLNLFTITSKAKVRASSVPMQMAFREICSEPGFRKHLDETMLRIADIESLGRTRELVAKDLVIGGHYEIETQHAAATGLGGGGAGGRPSKAVVRLRKLPGTRPAASTSPEDEPEESP